MWFCPYALEPNRTERFQKKPFLLRIQKSTDSGSKLNGSKGSSVNARLIRANFGTVPFGSSVNGVSGIHLIQSRTSAYNKQWVTNKNNKL